MAVTNRMREFTLGQNQVYSASRQRLSDEVGSDFGLTRPILSSYLRELVLPEYPRSTWGIWTRVPVVADEGIFSRIEIRLTPEAVDWVVLIRMIQQGGLAELWRIRTLLEVCIPDSYSIGSLRELWDERRSIRPFVQAIRIGTRTTEV